MIVHVLQHFEVVPVEVMFWFSLQPKLQNTTTKKNWIAISRVKSLVCWGFFLSVLQNKWKIHELIYLMVVLVDYILRSSSFHLVQPSKEVWFRWYLLGFLLAKKSRHQVSKSTWFLSLCVSTIFNRLVFVDPPFFLSFS